MLKNLFLLFICLLLIGGCLLQAFYLKKTSFSLRSLLLQIRRWCAARDIEQAIQAHSRLYGEWERRRPVLCSLLPHQQLDEIHLELLHLRVLLESGEASELEYSLQQLEYLFSHLPSAELLSMENIF